METETVICNYRVKVGSDADFRALLERHWPTLRELELATATPPAYYVGSEAGVEGSLFIEIFEWADGDAVERAHMHPAISPIWERMGEICEDRGGRLGMEFPHFRRLEFH